VLQPGVVLGPLLVLGVASGEDRWKEGAEGGKKKRQKQKGGSVALLVSLSLLALLWLFG